jgi:adenylosuccinate synthase
MYGQKSSTQLKSKTNHDIMFIMIKKINRRANSAVIVGGILGDEGKGRVTDELITYYLKKYKTAIVYRDNGGANAGHTIQVGDKKIALHQIGSGILHDDCIIILGKDMVLHPEDLVSELQQVKKIKGAGVLKQLLIDEMAVLSLDTHRAFETALKQSNGSGKGSTGRGISPAYADIIYRHPLRMRDLKKRNWQMLFKQHYKLYAKLISGLNLSLQTIEVNRVSGELVTVGSVKQFLAKLEVARKKLFKNIVDVQPFLEKSWQNKTPMVFEKAQALGLDKRWGVYPDITASNCAPDGIYSSTQGVVNPDKLEIKAAVIKSTYTSSVGSRVLPTMMDKKLAHKIREDANEYGSTTGRPRDIAYLDLPMLSYLCRVGKIEELVFTHMDIVYPDEPIKICINYLKNGKKIDYRPDQEFLNSVKPVYKIFKPWNVDKLKLAKKFEDLPKSAQTFIKFVCKHTKTQPYMLTSGPQRNQMMFMNYAR